MLVGIISDTHGLLRPEATAALQGCDLIIHAGDVGRPEILEELLGIAPTFAVQGNVDSGEWAAKLPLTQVVEAAAVKLFVIHDIAHLGLDPAAAGFAAVVFGHSHIPAIERRGDVLFLNPGSAGPRRFKLPVTMARMRVSGREMRPELLTLLPTEADLKPRPTATKKAAHD